MTTHHSVKPPDVLAKLQSNIRNLFNFKRVCTVCLNNTCNLRAETTVYSISCGDNLSEMSLKEIIGAAFGWKVTTLLPTCYYCESCIDVILKAYQMLEEIKFNHYILQYYANKLTDQMNMKLPDDVQSIVFELDYPNHQKHADYKESSSDHDTNDYDDEDEKPIKKLKIEKDENSKNMNSINGKKTIKLELSDVLSKISDQITLKKLKTEVPLKRSKRRNDTVGNKKISRNSVLSKVKTVSPKKEESIKESKSKKYYKCYLCQTTFTGQSELLKHSKKQCVQPGTVTLKHSNNTRSRANRKNILDTKKEICDRCGKIVASKYLAKHKRLHEKIQKQCPICAQFINKHSYEKHMFSHSGLPKMRPCPHCDYESKYLEALDAHINKEHLHTRPYKCGTCQKSFHSKMLLREHVRIHSRRKTEQCHICGDRFSYKKSLVLHMRIHTGYAPYKCDLCDESFLSASRRQSHKLTKHTGRSFECNICLKKFFLRSTMRCHQIKVHESKKAKTKITT